MTLREATVIALEALEAGDQRTATETLLNALEDAPRVDRVRCECGQTFQWPGLADAHRARGCAAADLDATLAEAA